MPALTKKKTKAKKRSYKQSLPMDKSVNKKRAHLRTLAKNRKIREQIKDLEKLLYPQIGWGSKLRRGK